MSQPGPIDAARAHVRTRRSNYPEIFAARLSGHEKRPLGDLFGLTNFGVNLMRLPRSSMSALRHAHSRQDEFIYVLEGTPTLVTHGGETPLAPGMCAGFRAGTGEAHRLINHATTDAVYIEMGDRSNSNHVVYPDEDMQAVFNENGQWRFPQKDVSPY